MVKKIQTTYQKVLVLYSGGRDSMLSTIFLLEQNYEVYLVHFDNSLEIGSKNIQAGINRLQKKYGLTKVKYIGIKKTDGIFRELIREFYNLKTKEINSLYGNMTISQFNCLACRLAMYIEAIILCRQLDIKYVADGARNIQLFAIEQDEMLKLFIELFNKYNIKLLLPVKDIKDDFELKNEFLIRGLIPKVSESQCLIGMPLDSKQVDIEIVKSSIIIYKNLLLPKTKTLIEKYEKVFIGENYL